MRGHRAAQVVGVGDDVDHARRDQVLDQLAQLQRGQRRGRRGLHDHRVAGEQGRAGP